MKLNTTKHYQSHCMEKSKQTFWPTQCSVKHFSLIFSFNTNSNPISQGLSNDILTWLLRRQNRNEQLYTNILSRNLSKKGKAYEKNKGGKEEE